MNIKKFSEFKINESVSVDYLKSMFSIIKDFPIEYLLNGQLIIETEFPPINDKGYSSCKETIKYYELLTKLWIDIESIADQIEMDGYDIMFSNRHGSIGVSITKDKIGNDKKFNTNLFIKYTTNNSYEEEFSIDEDQLKELCEMHNLVYDSYTVDMVNYRTDYPNYEISIRFTKSEDSRIFEFIEKLKQIDYCLGTYQTVKGVGFEIGNEDEDEIHLVYKTIE